MSIFNPHSLQLTGEENASVTKPEPRMSNGETVSEFMSKLYADMKAARVKREFTAVEKFGKHKGRKTRIHKAGGVTL